MIVPDGHCITRYKQNFYEVHCCCDQQYREECVIKTDQENNICATGTISESEVAIEKSSIKSLSVASRCVTSFLLNASKNGMIKLVNASYGIPRINPNTGANDCDRYSPKDSVTECTILENCNRMCPLRKPLQYSNELIKVSFITIIQII
ncbi:unnamed protein product [Thelazia callipaeda]|uniref:DUF1619 domain-containing protein n=1 Tax=Thelazia callipaeda TaxID=103827 RepID=A0A0N5CRV1_THECL|nr:unnamed protein product [Thelazia callipaeda]